MIKVREVIVVEGRYDKNTLSQIVDGTIIETEGFGIFSDREKLALFRRLAQAARALNRLPNDLRFKLGHSGRQSLQPGFFRESRHHVGCNPLQQVLCIRSLQKVFPIE